MQTPTHLKAGILIDRAIPEANRGLARQLTIALSGVISHAVLDALSALTYHPPGPARGDRFWFCYHAALAGLSFRVWRQNQEKHRFAMICSILPDLDWLLIKAPKILGIQLAFWQRPVLHEALFRSLPPLRLLNRLPDLSRRRAAVVMELAFYALLSKEPWTRLF